MTWVRLCFFCACGLSSFSAHTAQAQLFRRHHRVGECCPINRGQTYPIYTVQSCERSSAQSSVICASQELIGDCVCTTAPLGEVNATSCSCAETLTCTEQVPYAETKSFTASDPSSQIKEDIKRVKEKLDSIQPGQDPSLKKLQDDLREIKEMLKRNTNSSTEILNRVEESQRLVESIINGPERKWHDSTRTRHVQARLIAHDSCHVVLKRVDGEEFRIELAQLSNEDQLFIRSIQ
jgi:hypothetical protein